MLDWITHVLAQADEQGNGWLRLVVPALFVGLWVLASIVGQMGKRREEEERRRRQEMVRQQQEQRAEGEPGQLGSSPPPVPPALPFPGGVSTRQEMERRIADARRRRQMRTAEPEREEAADVRRRGPMRTEPEREEAADARRRSPMRTEPERQEPAEMQEPVDTVFSAPQVDEMAELRRQARERRRLQEEQARQLEARRQAEERISDQRRRTEELRRRQESDRVTELASVPMPQAPPQRVIGGREGARTAATPAALAQQRSQTQGVERNRGSDRPTAADAATLRRWLNPTTLRQQYILTELLSPPMALRPEREL